MLQSLVIQIISGILGLWLAVRFLPEVDFTGPTESLLLVGLILGIINFALKPIVNLLTLPLRILTLGLFGIVINMTMIWIVDIIFPELIIPGIIPLFWTTLIIVITSAILSIFGKGKI